MSEQREYEDAVASAVTLLHAEAALQAGSTHGQFCAEIANTLRRSKVIVVHSKSQERRISAQVAARDADARTIIVRLLGVIDQLFPGVKFIAVKDYAELNDAPLAANAFLKKIAKS